MASALADRAIGAIVGSAVADAAAQPLHWVYDLQKLHLILAQDPNPEFRAESANPFYRRQTGQQSCYGDQAFVLLESLSECGGLNVEDLKQRTLKFFGPGSEYDTPVNNPYRERGGPRPQLPIEGPWRHASLKSFLKNVDAGQEETGKPAASPFLPSEFRTTFVLRVRERLPDGRSNQTGPRGGFLCREARDAGKGGGCGARHPEQRRLCGRDFGSCQVPGALHTKRAGSNSPGVGDPSAQRPQPEAATGSGSSRGRYVGPPALVESWDRVTRQKLRLSSFL
uniref:Selenoprotein J n=1 Tax=Tetraodon nigroviridis TaxID=99883 RepID=H3BZX7_TETNG